jgi:hypothetical protein
VRTGRRQRHGFQRAGQVTLADLGVSARRVKDLALARAWTEAAGPTLAAQASVEARRGTLEVAAVDGVWSRAFAPILGNLAAHVAAACPDLHLTRYRLTVQGVPGLASPEPIPALHPAPAEAAGRVRRRDLAARGSNPGEAAGAAPATARAGGFDEARLRRHARRYGERQKP